MTMNWVWVLFTLGLFWEVSGQKQPLMKQDGSVNMSSVLNHIAVLEQTFQTKTAQLESEVQRTKSDLQVTRSELQTAQSEQRRSDAEISSLKDELAAVKTEVVMTSNDLISAKSEVASLKSKFLSLQAAMNQTQISQMSPMKRKPVAFSAWLTKMGYISRHPVKFDHVQYNEGNGYSNTTGKFTSPVSGTYMISAQIDMYFRDKYQATFLHIMKSGSIMAAGFGKSSLSDLDEITVPVTAVMYVGQGEEVWVQSTSAVQVNGGDTSWESSTRFVGVLVSAN